MKTLLIAALAATTALTGVMSAGAAAAQPYGYSQDRYRDSDRDGRPDVREWNRDRDRDGRPDQYDRRDRRSDRGEYRSGRQLRYYGGQYGYNGYQGRWRAGQRYSNYNNRSYYIDDYRAYGLAQPRPGYRYYRDNNGDVVMAAIATGVIGLIIAGALNDNDNDRDYGRGYDNGRGYYGR